MKRYTDVQLARETGTHHRSPAAGGSTDIVGRILAAELSVRLKQQVIIDERGGVVVKVSSAEFGRLMLSEQNKWLEVIKAAGITGE